MTFCEMPSIILTSDRVADACGACNLGRACGVSSFFLMRKRGESCMAKVFFSYQQQIESKRSIGGTLVDLPIFLDN